MSIKLRNGFWQWRKMVEGIEQTRSTKTANKALAMQIAKKWDHEAVQQIKVLGERPILLHDAIADFLADRKHLKSYKTGASHMKVWREALPNVQMKALHLPQVREVITNRIQAGYAHNTIAGHIMYWNALVNHCKAKRMSTGPSLERVRQVRVFSMVTKRCKAGWHHH